VNFSGIRHRLTISVDALLALTACGSGAPTTVGAQAPPATSDEPVAAVRKVESAAALLPAGVRKAGTRRVGSSIGFPPGAYHPNGTDKAPAGQDIDFADAVAKVLGVRLERQDASFETILPALGSGKHPLHDPVAHKRR
jgi:polar amino acid transport system substrate-binding protein